jgi:hypothetical protein
MYRATTTILLSAITFFISPAISTVCWGNNFGDAIDNEIWNVAYIQGTVNADSDVSPALINEQGNNPCGTTFNIDNSGFHSGYTLQGCGGDSMWLDQNGQFHASCTYEPQQICPDDNNIYTGCFQQQYCC